MSRKRVSGDYVEVKEPQDKRSRAAAKEPVEKLFEHFNGNSRYGPCDFYYHAESELWVLICKNKFKQQRKMRPLVLDKTDPQLLYPVVRELLGNPNVVNTEESSSVADSNLYRYAEYKAIFRPWKDQVMGLYTRLRFQDDVDPVGQLQLPDYEFINPGGVLEDGDLMWAVWRDEAAIQRKVKKLPLDRDRDVANLLQDFLGEPERAVGFTGYWKTELIYNGNRVDCANNLSFWATIFRDNNIQTWIAP